MPQANGKTNDNSTITKRMQQNKGKKWLQQREARQNKKQSMWLMTKPQNKSRMC